MKKFMTDLKKELEKNNIPEADIEEIIADYEDMIEVALEEGVTEEKFAEKFGDPAQIVRELNGSNQSDSKPNNEWKEFKVFEISEALEKIDIKLVSEDVEMIATDTDQITILSKKLREESKYVASFENNTLQLYKNREKMTRLFHFSSKSPSFKILIPAGTKLKDVRFNTVSGDLELDGIEAETFFIKQTSGDGSFRNLITGKADISNVSGDFDLQHVRADEISMSTVSGDVNMNTVQADEIHTNSVSGDSDYKEVTCKTLRYRSVSGDFKGKNVEIDEVAVKTVSGDFDIVSKQDKQVKVLSQKSLSGDINIK